jgi:hypothetical protein
VPGVLDARRVQACHQAREHEQEEVASVEAALVEREDVKAAVIPTRDPKVPYVRLANAEVRARERFPEAINVRAMWTPANTDSDVHVEVWTRVEPSEPARAQVWRP